MHLPGCLLQIKHRGGHHISVPLNIRLTIGSSHKNDVLITGTRLPARLACIYYKNGRYHIRHKQQTTDLTLNQELELCGFSFLLKRRRLSLRLIVFTLVIFVHAVSTKTYLKNTNNHPINCYNEVSAESLLLTKTAHLDEAIYSFNIAFNMNKPLIAKPHYDEIKSIQHWLDAALDAEPNCSEKNQIKSMQDKIKNTIGDP